MSFIALIFILAFSSGPQSDVRGFDSLEECQQWIDSVPGHIAAHNATGDEDKIVAFAASCVPVKAAPKGTEL